MIAMLQYTQYLVYTWYMILVLHKLHVHNSNPIFCSIYDLLDCKMQVYDHYVELSPIKDIIDKSLHVFNLIAFVISFHRKTISTKSGEQMDLLELFLCDDTSSNFAFRIWKQQAARLSQEIGNGCFLFLQNCKLKFSGVGGRGHEICGCVDMESAVHVLTKRRDHSSSSKSHLSAWDVYEEVKSYPTLFNKVTYLKDWVACEKPEMLLTTLANQSGPPQIPVLPQSKSVQTPVVVKSTQTPKEDQDRVLCMSWNELSSILRADDSEGHQVTRYVRTKVLLRAFRYFGEETFGAGSDGAELRHLFCTRHVVYLPAEEEGEKLTASSRVPTKLPPPPSPVLDMHYRDMCFLLGSPPRSSGKGLASQRTPGPSSSVSERAYEGPPERSSLFGAPPRPFMYSLIMGDSLLDESFGGCCPGDATPSASGSALLDRGETVIAIANNDAVCDLLGHVPASVLAHSLQLESLQPPQQQGNGRKRKAKDIDGPRLLSVHEGEPSSNVVYFNYAKAVRAVLRSLERCVELGEELEVLLAIVPTCPPPQTTSANTQNRWKEESLDMMGEIQRDHCTQPPPTGCGTPHWDVQLVHIYV